MPRVKEFNPELALTDVMHVFWRHGYGATSMEDIVSETGVSRYGLYGTFGNKKDLLVAALRHYEKSMNELFWSDLFKPDAGQKEIIEFLQSIREHSKDKEFRNGCLLVNVAVEVAPHEPEIATEVHRIDSEHSAAFTTAIRNGQKAGDISTVIDAYGSGWMLVSFLRGLALMARAGTKQSDLDRAIEAGLRILSFS